MKTRYRILFFLIGIGGIVLLAVKAVPDKSDWSELFTPRLPLLLLGLLLLWAVIYAIHTAVYLLIMGKEAASAVGFPRMYRICVSGFAINNVTPAGIVGGEPYRILELKEYMPAGKAASSAMTFNLIHMIGHMLLWITGALVYFALGCPGNTLTTVLLIIAALLLLTVVIYFFRKKKRGFVVPAVSFFAKLPLVGKKIAGLAEKHRDTLEETDSCYSEFCADRGRLYKAVLLEYATRLLEAVEYFLIFLYLGINIHFSGGILVLTFASLIGNLLFMIPMQAGTREGGIVLALACLGFDMETAVMGGLIFRIRDLSCIAVGILLILIGGKKKKESI